MSYKLFIDDERFPPDDGGDWVIARDLYEVAEIVENRGCPSFISFDHDLGADTPDGHDIAKYLVNLDVDLNQTFIKDGFEFYVHSQNPVGAANINGLIAQYLECRKWLNSN